MSITTNSELQSAMTTWLGHTLFATQYPDFITLFEAAAARRLRVRPMEAVATPASGTVALPADYLGWRRATWTGSPRNELVYVHPSYLKALYPTGQTGIPRHFTIEPWQLVTRDAELIRSAHVSCATCHPAIRPKVAARQMPC
jgi:hypothetical protein